MNAWHQIVSFRSQSGAPPPHLLWFPSSHAPATSEDEGTSNWGGLNLFFRMFLQLSIGRRNCSFGNIGSRNRSPIRSNPTEVRFR